MSHDDTDFPRCKHCDSCVEWDSHSMEDAPKLCAYCQTVEDAADEIERKRSGGLSRDELVALLDRHFAQFHQ